jgi:hypothetical protein
MIQRRTEEWAARRPYSYYPHTGNWTEALYVVVIKKADRHSFAILRIKAIPDPVTTQVLAVL